MLRDPSRGRLWPSLVIALALTAGGLSLVRAGESGRDGFVWRAERAGRTVYLAGALHFLAASDYPLPTPFMEAFRASGTVYFEVQPAEWNLLENRRRLETYGKLGRGNSLWTTLHPEDARKFRSALLQLGGSPRDYTHLRPWRASLDFQNLLCSKGGLDGKFGVDAYFAALARKSGKITRSLESARKQIEALADLSLGEEVALLMESVATVPTFNRDLRDLRGAWKEGDVERMTQVCDAAYEGNRERESALLGQRNLQWVEYIDRMAMQSNSTSMVIVGVNHLVVKKQNLLEELRKKGFTIERVRAVR
jgi:uncharacterized protein YbaP (TraB family)